MIPQQKNVFEDEEEEEEELEEEEEGHGCETTTTTWIYVYMESNSFFSHQKFLSCNDPLSTGSLNFNLFLEVHIVSNWCAGIH